MLEAETDVLVIGGGMAAAWAAIAAAREGAAVIMVDKGYVGASGVTATGGPGHWFVPPDGEKRAAAIAQRQSIAFGLGETRWMERILEETWKQLPTLEPFYKFCVNDEGTKLYGAVRGPEYMRALRRKAEGLGVRILDQSPALELLLHGNGAVAGARGVRRQAKEDWQIRAAGVVLATGGCAFFSRLLGSRTNTGDGYLMAAETGVPLSGMEFSSHYTIAPAFSTMARAMSYIFADFYGADGRKLDLPRQPGNEHALAKALLQGPVYCDLARMPQDIRERLPYISPNVLPPFRRLGIDPFTDRFPVTLLAEGTIRGIGGIKIEDESCQTATQGLFAAGDAASRELVAGASSGGGAVNSAWALSSGTWSGQAAAKRAKSIGRRAEARVERIGQAGLQPRRNGPAPKEAIAAARAEATSYNNNFFRTGQHLSRSLGMLDGLWHEIRAGLNGDPAHTREAAAITATARWCLTAASARRESRGMHVREDFPARDETLARRQTVHGLDSISSSFPQIMEAVP